MRSNAQFTQFIFFETVKAHSACPAFADRHRNLSPRPVVQQTAIEFAPHRQRPYIKKCTNANID